MPQHRRIVMALVAAVLATTALAGTNAAVLAVKDPSVVCSPNQLPTQWTDENHPPTSVRVLRTRGPNKGHVETVNLWTYVGNVLRIEYGGTPVAGPYMRVGALTVKQYAWYYAMHWRGGKVSFTVDNGDGTTSTTTECYDLYDTTQDQLYRPEKPDPNNPGAWLPNDVPTAVNLQAMRETWHLSLRKWQTKKNKSRLFLTGYRSGKKRACGTDADGFRVYQKSLRDCGTKGLSFEETLRKYFEPKLLIVDARTHDLADDAGWRGDLGLLVPSGSDTQWRIYKGSADAFTAGQTGTFNGLSMSSVLGYGVAQFDAADGSGSNDDKLLGDLVVLTNNDKVKVAKANGNGFDSLSTFDAPTGARRLLVGDFDGDLLDDVGVMTAPEPGTATLWVMLRQPGGGFDAAREWWAGALDVSGSTVFVAAADLNGDGMADIVARDAAGNYVSSVSVASCADMTLRGSCPPTAVGGGLGELTTWMSGSAGVPATATNLVADYDRDGRDDIVAVVNGTNFKVLGMRALSTGSFADPHQLYQSDSAFGAVNPVAMDVNSDGMPDLALATKDGTGTDIQWLRTNERTANPATMTSTGGAANAGVNWSADPRAF